MSNIKITWEWLCLAGVVPLAIALVIWAIRSDSDES